MIATRQVCDDSADLGAPAVDGVVRFKDARRTGTRHTAHGAETTHSGNGRRNCMRHGMAFKQADAFVISTSASRCDRTFRLLLYCRD
jgi:hypothetical protein